jgi:hypothetical protein
VEHLSPEPVPLAYSEDGTYQPDITFELLVLSLMHEYMPLGYGPVSLRGNPGMTFYYRPCAQLKPLPE